MDVRLLNGVEECKVTHVECRLGLRWNVRLVVLGNPIFFSECAQLCKLLRVVEHGAVIEFFTSWY